MEAEYASNAKGNTGVTLGAIGTGLGALNTIAGGIMGMNGGVANGGNRPAPVTQEQMKDQQTISGLQSSLALSDAKYANEVGENTKMTEVYRTLAIRDREIEGRVTKVETWQAAQSAAFDEYKKSQCEIQRLRDENMHLYVDNRICPVNAKADTALAYINKIAAVGVLNTQVFTPPA